MFYINNKGSLMKVKGSKICNKNEEIELAGLYSSTLNDEYDLWINSFKNSILIINKKMSKNLIASNKISKWHALYSFFENNEKKLKRKYLKEIEKSKNISRITFAICPSFSCNLKCSYCFQQHSNELNKKRISNENLNTLFYWIERQILNYSIKKDNRRINIELFGGEPLQLHQKDQIKKIFEFARKNKIGVTATSNLVEVS